jgi:putative transposase
MAWPFLGSRRMARMMQDDGAAVNCKRVQRLMRLAGMAGPKPRTSTPAPGHGIFPYLLRGLRIDRPNQVWAWTSPTHPLAAAFSIWWRASRAALSWRLSNTMDVSFCVAALDEALEGSAA